MWRWWCLWMVWWKWWCWWWCWCCWIFRHWIICRDGGQSVSAGQLTSEGIVPTGGTGGKVESCTTGDYWLGQGVDACSDVGNVKFRIILEMKFLVLQQFKEDIKQMVHQKMDSDLMVEVVFTSKWNLCWWRRCRSIRWKRSSIRQIWWWRWKWLHKWKCKCYKHFVR